MTHLITSWVENGGLVAVFVLMALESCGIPIPSEVIMPFAGYFTFSGHMNGAAAVIAGAAGNLAGSLAAYVLAGRYGRPLLLGPGRWLGISARHLELADRWFGRYGLPAVFIGRLVPVVRTYISFPAGLARVEPSRFTALTFLGALPWCLALLLAGYAVGANYDRVAAPIEKAAIVVAVVVVAIVVTWFVKGRAARSGAR
jgi:membrane protein DedA with SNARE-associated domain